MLPPPSPSFDGAGNKPKIGYYKNQCRVDVEAIIRKHVSSFNDGMKAGLMRLFFHDCFVRVRYPSCCSSIAILCIASKYA
jgi:peroxidase